MRELKQSTYTNNEAGNSRMFWNKITLIQFVLSVSIVLRHANPGNSWGIQGGVLVFTQIITDITHFAVPAFFIISGFLFYRNISPYLTMAQFRPIYFDKVKRRIASLVVPYLFWNFAAWLFYTVCTHLTIISSRMNMDPTALSVAGILKAILLSEYTPLWFVGNLIIYSAFASLIFAFLKNKHIGTAIIISLTIAVFAFEISPSLIQWFPIYLFGCFLGLHYDESVICCLSGSNAFKKRKYAELTVALVLFISAFVIFCFTKSFRSLFIFRIISCVAVIVIINIFLGHCRIIEQHELPGYAKTSFFIYCVHYVQLVCFDKIALIFFGNGTVSYIVTYFGGWIIITVLCIAEAYTLKKLTPRFYRVVCGGR
ncbi:MAG: acyltransferase [Lachnospiraceae bacterium]|nr:acyltransferase [Lachnospiraceae bacterium]